jgi:hypothetical protein
MTSTLIRTEESSSEMCINEKDAGVERSVVDGIAETAVVWCAQTGVVISKTDHGGASSGGGAQQIV